MLSFEGRQTSRFFSVGPALCPLNEEVAEDLQPSNGSHLLWVDEVAVQRRRLVVAKNMDQLGVPLRSMIRHHADPCTRDNCSSQGLGIVETQVNLTRRCKVRKAGQEPVDPEEVRRLIIGERDQAVVLECLQRLRLAEALEVIL